MDAEFVKEYADEKGLTPSDRNVLLKMEEKAGAENRNICDYSTEEILECLRGYNSRSINTLQKYTSLLRQYIDYCIEQGKTQNQEDPVNPCRDLSKEELDSCLKKDNNIYYKLKLSTILDMANNMQNPADKFIIIGSYEGFTLGDILALRSFHFKYEDRLIYHSKIRRWFTHSDELMQYGWEALRDYKYYNGYYITRMEDVDDQGASVIKKKCSSKHIPDAHTINSRLGRKSTSISDSFQNVTPKVINKFGFYQALYICSEQYLDFMNNDNPSYRMLVERFGRELSRTSSIKMEYESVRKERTNDIRVSDIEAYEYWKRLLRDEFIQAENSTKHQNREF